MAEKTTKIFRRFTGEIVSDKMDKTVVVRIDVVNTDKVYGKKFLRSKKFKVHDPREEYKVGDVVQIEESRHLSRDKYYRIVKKVK